MIPHLHEKLIYLRRKKLEQGKKPGQLKWIIGNETIKALHSDYLLESEIASPNPNIMGIVFDIVPGDIIDLIDLNLSPGPELDELIAKKIFNWYKKSVDQYSRILGYYQHPVWYDENDERVPLNRFSTDIKAAWDLAERFRFCVVPWGEGWTAFREGQFYNDGDKNKASTAAHAICLAALNLVGRE